MNADMDHINARLEDGVLRITVPKLAEEKMKHAKVISIAGSGSTGEDVKATTKTELWGSCGACFQAPTFACSKYVCECITLRNKWFGDAQFDVL